MSDSCIPESLGGGSGSPARDNHHPCSPSITFEHCEPDSRHTSFQAHVDSNNSSRQALSAGDYGNLVSTRNTSPEVSLEVDRLSRQEMYTMLAESDRNNLSSPRELRRSVSFSPHSKVYKYDIESDGCERAERKARRENSKCPEGSRRRMKREGTLCGQGDGVKLAKLNKNTTRDLNKEEKLEMACDSLASSDSDSDSDSDFEGLGKHSKAP